MKAEGQPVLIHCYEESRFRLAASQLEAAIMPRTRWVVLNSLSNPTGAAYGEAHYRPLIEVLLRHAHVRLLVDDVYEHIVYDDFRFVTPAATEPRLKARTLTVNGVPKAYAMTGWRIGYAGGSRSDQGDGRSAKPVDVLPVFDQPGRFGRSIIPTVAGADSFVISEVRRTVIPCCHRRFGDGISGEGSSGLLSG